MLPTRDSFHTEDTYKLKKRVWKNIDQANGCQKKPRVAIRISDKIDFQTKSVTRDKERHNKIIKENIQEDIIIVNIYSPNME